MCGNPSASPFQTMKLLLHLTLPKFSVQIVYKGRGVLIPYTYSRSSVSGAELHAGVTRQASVAAECTSCLKARPQQLGCCPHMGGSLSDLSLDASVTSSCVYLVALVCVPGRDLCVPDSFFKQCVGTCLSVWLILRFTLSLCIF